MRVEFVAGARETRRKPAQPADCTTEVADCTTEVAEPWRRDAHVAKEFVKCQSFLGRLFFTFLPNLISGVARSGCNALALSGAGKRTAASGVAWSGCASLRGPLCAGEALLEARTQASVALFKLGAHSATLRPEFGGPKSLRCCCAKGVGHRAQLMLRARRGDRENNHPVPLLRTPTPQNALSLLSSLRGVTTTKSLD